MTAYTVIVTYNKEKIVFPRVWGVTKTDVCMEYLVYVKNFYKLTMEEFGQLTATAQVNREVMA